MIVFADSPDFCFECTVTTFRKYRCCCQILYYEKLAAATLWRLRFATSAGPSTETRYPIMTCHIIEQGDIENGIIIEVSKTSDESKGPKWIMKANDFCLTDKFKMAVTGANFVTVERIELAQL